MPFNSNFFDTLYDLKTENEVMRRMREMIKEYSQMKKEYETMHRQLREQGVKIPKDLPHVMPL